MLVVNITFLWLFYNKTCSFIPLFQLYMLPSLMVYFWLCVFLMLHLLWLLKLCQIFTWVLPTMKSNDCCVYSAGIKHRPILIFRNMISPHLTNTTCTTSVPLWDVVCLHFLVQVYFDSLGALDMSPIWSKGWTVARPVWFKICCSLLLVLKLLSLFA